MKAIPVLVRERILKLYDQGRSTAEVAASFGYCVAAVRRVRQQFKARGTLEPQTHRCGRKSLLTESRKARLETLLADQPDATLAELGAQFKRPTSTMDLWLARLGWTPFISRVRSMSSYGSGRKSLSPGCGRIMPGRPRREFLRSHLRHAAAAERPCYFKSPIRSLVQSISFLSASSRHTKTPAWRSR